MKNKIEDYDERQVQIREKIFKHGFFTAVFALLINAFLNSYGVVWADGFKQNLLILMLITTVVTVEFQVHDVFFGKVVKPGLITGIFTGCALILIFLSVKHFAEGSEFATDNMLTDEGWSVIFAFLVSVNAVIGLIQYFKNKKQEKEK